MEHYLSSKKMADLSVSIPSDVTAFPHTSDIQPIDLSDKSIIGLNEQTTGYASSVSSFDRSCGGTSDHEGLMLHSPSSRSCSSHDDAGHTTPLTEGSEGARGASSLTRQNHVGTVMLRDVSIVSLIIDGKERLCLAQISNTLLKNFSYNEIHNRRVALGITCVQCTPVQLEILRRFGAMPISSRRCGMITKREAERLVTSFLEEHAPPKLPETFAFSVVHECGWGCKGSFMPARYNSSRAKCIKCTYCSAFLSPNKFIFHFHRTPDAKYHHPDAANFNSWRRHLVLDYCESNEALIHAWEDVKAMFNGGSRKRLSSPCSSSKSSMMAVYGGGDGSSSQQEPRVEQARKRSRIVDHNEDTSTFTNVCKAPMESCISQYHRSMSLTGSPHHPPRQLLQAPMSSQYFPSLPLLSAIRPPMSGHYYDAMKMHMMDFWKAKTHPHHPPPPLLSHPQPSAILSPLNMFWGKGFQYPSIPQAAAAASLLCRNATNIQDVKQQQASRSSLKLMMTKSILGRESPVSGMTFSNEHDRRSRHSLSDSIGGAAAAAAMAAAQWTTPFSAFRSLRTASDVILNDDCIASKKHLVESALGTTKSEDVLITESSEVQSYQPKYESDHDSRSIITQSSQRMSPNDLDKNGNKFRSTEKEDTSDGGNYAGGTQTISRNNDSGLSSTLPWDWPHYRPSKSQPTISNLTSDQVGHKPGT